MTPKDTPKGLDEILDNVAIDCTNSTLPQRVSIVNEAKRLIKSYVLEQRLDEAHKALAMNEGSQNAQLERIAELNNERKRMEL